jgi:Fe2+ or Zn2+ uptake regulation protein
MYVYQAINTFTGAKVTHNFSTEEEANAFAAKHSEDHHSHDIFTEMEIGDDETEDELDWEQEEKAILSDMGLDDEETNQGFDYDDFFDNE